MEWGVTIAPEGRAELFAALAKAQGDIGKVTKGESATIPLKAGGKYSYSYADLASYLEAARQPLAENGLSVTQFPATRLGGDGGMVHVTTVVGHEAGGYMEGTLGLPLTIDAMLDPKAVGGAITYARRYAFGAVLGMAADDDDASHASERSTSTRRQAPPQQDTSGEPGAFVIGFGKHKGLRMDAVPVGYLRDYILGGEFDKADVKAAASAYLATLAGPDDQAMLEELAHIAKRDGHAVNPAKVISGLEKQREDHHGGVPLAWYDAARTSILSYYTDTAEQNDAWLEAVRTVSGGADPDKVPADEAPGVDADDIGFGD